MQGRYYEILEGSDDFRNWMISATVKGWETPTLLGPLQAANLNYWSIS
jgi:hypothetical protein